MGIIRRGLDWYRSSVIKAIPFSIISRSLRCVSTDITLRSVVGGPAAGVLPGPGNGRIESRPQSAEARLWAVPLQCVHIVKQRDVGPESCQRSEQQRVFALVGERAREATGVGCVHAPFAPVGWNGFEVDELGENRG